MFFAPNRMSRRHLLLPDAYVFGADGEAREAEVDRTKLMAKQVRLYMLGSRTFDVVLQWELMRYHVGVG
jgi:hypothetical protein